MLRDERPPGLESSQPQQHASPHLLPRHPRRRHLHAELAQHIHGLLFLETEGRVHKVRLDYRRRGNRDCRLSGNVRRASVLCVIEFVSAHGGGFRLLPGTLYSPRIRNGVGGDVYLCFNLSRYLLYFPLFPRVLMGLIILDDISIHSFSL